MRLLICGSRNWTDGDLIKAVLEHVKPDVVIQGGCRGADRLAAQTARKLGIRVFTYLAQWSKYGKGAGHIRNKQMLEEGKPDAVIAFHDDIDNSKGTKNMVEQARKAGLEATVVSHADAGIYVK